MADKDPPVRQSIFKRHSSLLATGILIFSFSRDAGTSELAYPSVATDGAPASGSANTANNGNLSGGTQPRLSLDLRGAIKPLIAAPVIELKTSPLEPDPDFAEPIQTAIPVSPEASLAEPAPSAIPAMPASQLDQKEPTHAETRSLGDMVGEGRKTFDNAKTPKTDVDAEISGVAPKEKRSSNAVRNAVILGGGPAGLVSALTLLKNGARVTIVEQRDAYTRPINFALRQDLLDEIAYLAPDLLKPLFKKMGPVESIELTDMRTGEVVLVPPTVPKSPDGAMGRFNPSAMLDSSHAALIRASDLEQILHGHLQKIMREDLARGLTPRVRILENAQAGITETRPGKYSVLVQEVSSRKGKSGRSERVPVGSPKELPSADLIIVAEGSNSGARQALGIRTRPTSPKTRFIAASIDYSVGGRIRSRYSEIADPRSGEIFGLRRTVMGNSVTGKSWVLVEVPPFLALETPKQVQDYFTSQIDGVLQMTKEQAARQRFESDPVQFELQQQIAERATAGDNVVLIGDAVGTAHFSPGAGMMTATVPHQQVLERLLHQLASSSSSHRRAELLNYQLGVRQATLQWTRVGLRYFGRKTSAEEAEARFGELMEDLSGKEPSLLTTLVDSGLLEQTIEEEMSERVGRASSVRTLPRPKPVPFLGEARDLRELDGQMAALIGGSLWERLKTASNRFMDAIDRIGNELRVPPEGIHPIFALAAKPLLQAAQGKPVAKSSRETADRGLAEEVARAPQASLATIEVFLNQNHIHSRLAPRARKALERRLGPMPPVLANLVGALPPSEKLWGERIKDDRRLSALTRALSATGLLRLQALLARRGFIDHRLTFFSWRPDPAFARTFPKTTADMMSRDARQELLEEGLRNDAVYQEAAHEKQALISLAVEAMIGSPEKGDLALFIAGFPSGDRRMQAARLVDWALLQDQKLRFLKSESQAQRHPEEAGEDRTIERTFLDHLRARRAGDLETDLRLNYDPDVVFTSNQGNFFGHQGVRDSAAVLNRLVPGRDWTMNRLSFIPTAGPREGYAIEIWSTESPGVLVTAVDNFYIKNGRILMQSAYYLDPREGLSRH